MNVDIKFSIIIPLFNKKDYISRTLESVLAQSYIDYEVIVVDDGSTDGSCDVVQNFHDERIKLVSKSNGGVSSARNYGMSLAKNNYFVFLDADDWWDKNFLANMATLIHKCPQAKMFASSFAEVVDSKLNNAITFDCFEKEYLGYIDYISAFQKYLLSPICTSAVVIDRNLYEEGISFDERIASGEDLAVWLQIAFKYPVAFYNVVLSFYNRDVAGSITTKLCPWEKYYIFYINDILEIDSNKKKKLIDSLILRFIRPYYSLELCGSKADAILRSVDFKKQSLCNNIYYKMPKAIATMIYKLIYYMRGNKFLAS